MLNFIAMAAILAAIFLSRSGRTVPAIMLAYYFVALASMHLILGTIDANQPVILSPERANLWYITSISIDVIFIVGVMLVCSFERLSAFYRFVILYIVLTKVFGLVFGSTENEWFVTTYEIMKSPVVLLEVSIAWLASDNLVSRRIYEWKVSACQTIKSAL